MKRKAVGGAEVDAFGSWRKYLKFRAGERKKLKRQSNKRERKEARVKEIPTNLVDFWEDSRTSMEVKVMPLVTLEQMMERLNPTEQLIVTARVFELLTWPEMAERFGMGKTTVQRWYDTALAKLAVES